MKPTKLHYSVLLLALLAFFVSDIVAAPIGTAFTYQGRLASGTNGAIGLYDFSFALFDADSVGTQKGPTLTTNGVPVTNGLFTVTLDFGNVFDGNARWLAVSVKTNGPGGYTVLTNRQPLTPTPYAIFASSLSSNVNQTFVGTVSFDPVSRPPFTVSSSIMVSNLNANLLDGLDSTAFWKLSGNPGSTAGANFLGTVDNQPLELKVNGIRALRLEPASGTPNVIGGGPNNSVVGSVSAFIGGGSGNSIQTNASGSAIAGGTNNMIGSPWYGSYDPSSESFIGGGAGNSVNVGQYSTIGGGIGNSISDPPRLFNAYGDTIAGGASNTINFFFPASFCTIGGGSQNSIGAAGDVGGIGGTVAGGANNHLEYATYGSIAGGLGNIINSFSSAAIGGGSGNQVGDWFQFAGTYGDGGTIGGGQGNLVLQNNGTIAGGTGNSVVGGTEFNQTVAGTIGGGLSNTVNGAYGTIPGGLSNEATDYAFAAGRRAKAVHQGAMVWATGNTNDYPSDSTNRVLIYAERGVEVEYGGQDSSGRGLKWLVLASATPGRVINVYNGAYLSEGGTWTDVSDRNAKKDFEPVNSREVLEQVSKLPLTRWSYRSENESARHLGPVAQDFCAAFGLGADDKHIAALDSSGVALAAIQGLNEKLSEELGSVRAANAQLKARLERLEQLINIKDGGGK